MIPMAPSTASAVHLPTPEERPEADILIFDGNCSFCRAQVERFARWDRRRQLAFLSLHDPQVYQRFPHLHPDELMREMVIVDRHGNHHAGAAAIRYLSRHLHRLWPLAPISALTRYDAALEMGLSAGGGAAIRAGAIDEMYQR